jgi:hypothetical protein
MKKKYKMQFNYGGYDPNIYKFLKKNVSKTKR